MMEKVEFKHILPIQMRFNDFDTLGHLNNTVYFSFYDLGKTTYFEAVLREKIDRTNLDLVIAHIEVDFISPVSPAENIAVQTAVVEIGRKSFKLFQQLIDVDTKDVKCVCRTVMVGFDVRTNTSKLLSDRWKEAITRYEGRNDLIRSV